MSKIIGICVNIILVLSIEHVLAVQNQSMTNFPKPPYCGKPLSDRLFGGLRTELDEFPWTALIEYRKPDNQTTFSCEGSLVNSRYVLTAAHCVHSIPSGWEMIGVRLGEWDLTKELDCEDLSGYCADIPVNVGIEKIIVHEEYRSSKSHYNDIALIRLNSSVVMSDFISPVCLPIDEPQRSQNNVGLQGYTAGWGRNGSGTPSEAKLHILMKISDSNSCANIYERLGVVIEDTQLCAEGLIGRDLCRSISVGGSPFTRQEDIFNYQYGITSMGPRNCGSMPEVYTNVANYIDWIESKME